MPDRSIAREAIDWDKAPRIRLPDEVPPRNSVPFRKRRSGRWVSPKARRQMRKAHPRP